MELYVHIPYCQQKCRYCDFASYAGQNATMAAYVLAVIDEARACPPACAESAYLGGGTPSILPPKELEHLLTGVLGIFPLVDGAEFTAEANPGTLTKAWLDTARRFGVNRLSMGMQAYQPELLRTLGRIHDAEQVRQSAALARCCGFEHISLDLMFGLPGQTLTQWRETLEFALSLSPEHLSCYGLIPEEGTPLYADLQAGRLTLPAEEDERAMYDLALKMLSERGFHQYEISNFALPGCECRHNIGYWRQIPYIGLGASAASCLEVQEGSLRTTNPARIQDYIDMVHRGSWAQREATLVKREEARFETLMLGLRMTEGVSEAFFQSKHGVSMESLYGSRLRRFESQGLLEHHQGFWRLTRRGMDVQNAILVELMDD